MEGTVPVKLIVGNHKLFKVDPILMMSYFDITSEKEFTPVPFRGQQILTYVIDGSMLY